MHRISSVHNQEIVHQFSVRHQGLRPDSGIRRNQVIFSYFRDELLKTPYERPFAH